MKTPIKYFFLLVFLTAMSATFTQAQHSTLDVGVKAHKDIDEIYSKFSEAYKTLKPEIVAGLYTETADYLSPGAKPLKGRAAILENFTGFFNGVKERGQTMVITFQINQRDVSGDMGYDIGVYTLTMMKDGKQIHQGKGRFVVVTKKVGGKWYFQLDSYTNLPEEKK